MIAANYQGYHQELSDLRLAFSRSGAVTGVVLVMLGVGLDTACIRSIRCCSASRGSSSR